MTFYVLAGLQSIMVFILGSAAFVDVGLFAILGLWLHRKPGRLPATLALGLGLLAIVTTILNRLGFGFGGRNIVLAFITFWAALRAVLAAYKLPGLLEEHHANGAAG